MLFAVTSDLRVAAAAAAAAAAVAVVVVSCPGCDGSRLFLFLSSLRWLLLLLLFFFSYFCLVIWELCVSVCGHA